MLHVLYIPAVGKANVEDVVDNLQFDISMWRWAWRRQEQFSLLQTSWLDMTARLSEAEQNMTTSDMKALQEIEEQSFIPCHLAERLQPCQWPCCGRDDHWPRGWRSRRTSLFDLRKRELVRKKSYEMMREEEGRREERGRVGWRRAVDGRRRVDTGSEGLKQNLCDDPISYINKSKSKIFSHLPQVVHRDFPWHSATNTMLAANQRAWIANKVKNREKTMMKVMKAACE